MSIRTCFGGAELFYGHTDKALKNINFGVLFMHEWDKSKSTYSYLMTMLFVSLSQMFRQPYDHHTRWFQSCLVSFIVRQCRQKAQTVRICQLDKLDNLALFPLDFILLDNFLFVSGPHSTVKFFQSLQQLGTCHGNIVSLQNRRLENPKEHLIANIGSGNVKVKSVDKSDAKSFYSFSKKSSNQNSQIAMVEQFGTFSAGLLNHNLCQWNSSNWVNTNFVICFHFETFKVGDWKIRTNSWLRCPDGPDWI